MGRALPDEDDYALDCRDNPPSLRSKLPPGLHLNSAEPACELACSPAESPEEEKEGDEPLEDEDVGESAAGSPTRPRLPVARCVSRRARVQARARERNQRRGVGQSGAEGARARVGAGEAAPSPPPSSPLTCPAPSLISQVPLSTASASISRGAG
jgi:hypothetical protein